MTLGRARVKVLPEVFGKGMLNWLGKVKLDNVCLLIQGHLVLVIGPFLDLVIEPFGNNYDYGVSLSIRRPYHCYDVVTFSKGQLKLSCTVCLNHSFKWNLPWQMSSSDISKSVLFKDPSAGKKSASHHVVESKAIAYLSDCYFRLANTSRFFFIV